MISTLDNCLYIHIPKTAGQSIESVFLERAGIPWQQREQFLLRENSDKRKGPPRLAHLTANEYLELNYLTQQKFDQLYRFTFVRNPWDRLVSEYLYKKHSFSFKDFIFKHFPAEGVDDYQKHNGIYRHVMPQYKFIYNKQGESMVDYIGKFENIENDFSSLTKNICGTALTLPHRNKTNSPRIAERFKRYIGLPKPQKLKNHYSKYYDAETRDWVAEFYKKDIELFNYHFE
jgi:hypothetical protein